MCRRIVHRLGVELWGDACTGFVLAHTDQRAAASGAHGRNRLCGPVVKHILRKMRKVGDLERETRLRIAHIGIVIYLIGWLDLFPGRHILWSLAPAQLEFAQSVALFEPVLESGDLEAIIGRQRPERKDAFGIAKAW